MPVRSASVEQLDDDVPIQHQLAGVLEDLVVEVDLRRVDDAGHELTQTADRAAEIGARRVERAGEDHRHAGPGGTVRSRQLAHHPDAAELAVVEVARELRLQGSSPEWRSPIRPRSAPASNVTVVKSPSTSAICSCTGSRLLIVTFSVNGAEPDQAASTSA